MLPDSLTELLPGDGSKVVLTGLNLPALARKVAQLLDGPLRWRRILVITPTAIEAEDLVGDLSYFRPEGRLGILYSLELRPFIGTLVGSGAAAERLGALSLLSGGSAP